MEFKLQLFSFKDILKSIVVSFVYLPSVITLSKKAQGFSHVINTRHQCGTKL